MALSCLSSSLRALVVAPVLACAAPAAGPVVVAPAEGQAPVAPRAASAGVAAPERAPGRTACALPWTVEDVAGGPARAVVVCGSDVRRTVVDPAVLARAVGPALELARARVCACAARLQAPEYVDLVVTSRPDEGRARVEASEPDDDLDAATAAAFVACVGTVAATFPGSHPDACGAERSTLVYPFRVDLAR